MRSDFRIRPARPQDKEAVLEFTRHTWGEENGDYIPEVWDAWLADRQGRFLVAELEGRPVGIGKVTLQGEGECWLEGLRVAPQYRGSGIAHTLQLEATKVARELGAQIVRFATASWNEAVQHMAQEDGFSRVARFAYYEAASDPDQAGRRAREPFVLEERVLPALRRASHESQYLLASQGLYAIGWSWRALSVERLRQHLKKGEILAYIGPGGGVDAWAILTSPWGSSAAWVSFLDGAPAAVEELSQIVRARAGRAAAKEVQAMFPIDWEHLPLLEELGYQREMDAELWVFEQRFA